MAYNRHVHGGNLYEASKVYGISSSQILDYSANINPLGIPDVLRDILISNIDNLVNYPDPECNDLRNHISKYLSLPNENIVIGNGASEIIFLLFNALKPGKVLIPAPTFAEYAKAAESSGARVEYLELKESEDFKLDIELLVENASRGINAVVLCNPNNPTSTLVTKDDMSELISRLHTQGIYIVIDEAFIELTAGGNSNSVSDLVHTYDNLFIVRAFTKIFAIPGLRLGYGLGDKKLVKSMWDMKMPWSVNSLACSTGKMLPEGGEYMEKTSKWLVHEKKWLFEELSKIGVIKVFEPQTNFILAKILDEELNAHRLRDTMAAQGILIRDASNFMFLNGRFFRVAVKDRKSNEIFVEKLRNVLI